jgi:hypothetical protein
VTNSGGVRLPAFAEGFGEPSAAGVVVVQNWTIELGARGQPSSTILLYWIAVEPSEFDEVAFFQAVARSGARALLIGRRALVLLGLPVLTADYDFWLAVDDIAVFNAACASFGLTPTRTPDAARSAGRYALENDEHVDVIVARSMPTVDGTRVEFESLWKRKTSVELGHGAVVHLPAIRDLILTKQVVSRPKDLEDIRLLRLLLDENER